MERRILTRMEKLSLIEKLAHELYCIDLSQVDDVLKIVKTRIALKTMEREPELPVVSVHSPAD